MLGRTEIEPALTKLAAGHRVLRKTQAPIRSRRNFAVASLSGEGLLRETHSSRSDSAARTALDAPKPPPGGWRTASEKGSRLSLKKFMISATRSWSLTMTRFMFLVLERHRVVAPTSARPLAAPVPAL